MAEHSKIEWTDSTWNPIRARNVQTGRIGWHCEHESEGCRFCYAETQFNMRMGTQLPYKPGHRKDIEIFLDEKMLLAPLKWKKPRMIFPGSMTDLFADFVTDEMLDKIFAVMALTPWHTYQPLTKRATRMREYFVGKERYRDVHPLEDRHDAINRAMDAIAPAQWCKRELQDYSEEGLPLPNVWLGISAEDQARADERIPDLLQTPAAVRFVSLEPLLGPIDLFRINETTGFTFNALSKKQGISFRGAGLDWIIVGGESGPNARPMHPDWPRSIRDQCQAAGVPFFFKQWGENKPEYVRASLKHDAPMELHFERVGKKVAGRLLDGKLHDGMPG